MEWGMDDDDNEGNELYRIQMVQSKLLVQPYSRILE